MGGVVALLNSIRKIRRRHHLSLRSFHASSEHVKFDKKGPFTNLPRMGITQAIWETAEGSNVYQSDVTTPAPCPQIPAWWNILLLTN